MAASKNGDGASHGADKRVSKRTATLETTKRGPSSTRKPSSKANEETLQQRVGRLSDSLRTTAAETDSIEAATERLISVGNEHAAASEQMRASVESVAGSIEETHATVQVLARSQLEVSNN